jgi:hypothetical protein
MGWNIENIVKALPANHEVLEVAGAMEVGQRYPGLTKTEAGQLVRAIESVHGVRTATRTADKGAETFSVTRVVARALKARKPKAAKEVAE